MKFLNFFPDNLYHTPWEYMARAYLPRAADGLIVTLAPYSSAPWASSLGPLYFPHTVPDKNGMVTPVLDPQDFADGNVPEYWEYDLGVEVVRVNQWGQIFSRVVFDNPLFNLPPKEQWMLLQAYASLPAPPVSNFASPPPAYIIVAAPQGMIMKTEDRQEHLSNFTARAIERHVVIRNGEKPHEEFVIAVYCNGTAYQMMVRGDQLDNLAPLIVKQFPVCYVEADASKASARIANYVRGEIPSLPTIQIIKSPGFIKINGQWVYAHDGAKPPEATVVFQTGCTIPVNPGITPDQALRCASGVLKLSRDEQLGLGLFLFAHLGPLCQLFESAGVSPRLVGFLNGETGSFKTSVALCLFRLFRELPTTPEASFLDTPTALEVKIGEAVGRVLVIDDFQPAVTAASGKEKLEKLEFIIRLYGDRIAKSRSNTSLTLGKELHPAGCCLVTGEDTGGSRSSLLRCLVLSIARGDIDGAKLKAYQDHPEYLQSHFFNFLSWAGLNGEAIIDFIHEDFQRERSYFSQSIKEPRQVDVAAILMVTAQILLQYASSMNAIPSDNAADVEEHWRKGITALVRQSEAYSRETDPATMYLQALLDLYTAGKIKVAASQGAFMAGVHQGFARDGDWWLLPHEVYTRVMHYWQEQKVVFPLKESKVHAALYKNSLIDVDHEFRDGQKKILYVRKSTLPERPRMLVLHIAQAQKFLERNKNS